MSEYGLTNKGPNIKRLDVILNEMHDDLSEKWGVNTRQNPQSFINHLLTNIADRFAELWEFGENVYYSQYPASAEGISLDCAAQYGGVTRAMGAKSYYPIHCTGIDGTVISTETTIASTTNPKTYLKPSESKTISRNSFNKATIKIVSRGVGVSYQVVIDGHSYSFVSVTDTASDILDGLAVAIDDPHFTVSVIPDTELLQIVSNSVETSHDLTLSGNLTTETVTTIISFGTEEDGDISIPNGVITEIVKGDAGLSSVVNLCSYIAGNGEETDSEFRASYINKIYNRSSMILASIKSAIINNVQGVKSVAVYENDTNSTDAQSRPPHSIEVIVEGGDSNKIAEQILAYKPGGIATYGSVSISLPGINDETITVNFNRPTTKNIWAKLTVSNKSGETLPANYVAILKSVILKKIEGLEAGEDVVPQEFMSELYGACTGLGYIDIALSTDAEGENDPRVYEERYVSVTDRQKAYMDGDMIEVVLDV